MDSPEVQPYLGSRLDLHCVAHIVQLRRLKGGVRPSGVPGLGFFLVFFFCFVFVFVFDFSFFDRNCGSISLLLFFFSKKKNMCACCRHTRDVSNTNGKRFESTHGGHRQFCLPRKAHVGSSRASEVHRKQPLNVAHVQV